MLAYYDFATRTCILHRIGNPRESAISWFYYADLHAIAGLPRRSGRACLAVDLAETGAKAADDIAGVGRDRSRRPRGVSPYPFPRVVATSSDPWVDLNCRAVRLDARTGTLEYRQGSAGPAR